MPIDSLTPTKYAYDIANRLTRTTLADNSTIDIAYDSLNIGVPKTVTFDRGQISFTCSSATGNLSSVTAPGSNTLNYIYDGSLPLSEAWGGQVTGTVSMKYDNELRPVQQKVMDHLGSVGWSLPTSARPLHNSSLCTGSIHRSSLLFLSNNSLIDKGNLSDMPPLPRRSLLIACILLSAMGCGKPDRSVHRSITMNPVQEKHPNLLIYEKSPYLLQHAYNPVHWHPWGEAAFDEARRDDKPIFLSIGYSTCHWCHVMEHESFESDSIAALLNEYFVCIKVDREERPDVDQVYMTALQAMGQNGGWPLSMFLTPDRQPFFGGTYFPPVSRYGRPGFPEILKRIHAAWTTERSKVVSSGNSVTQFLREQVQQTVPETELTPGLLDSCFVQLRASYDDAMGGFGGAPKFPRPVIFNFLLRYHARTGDRSALEMTGSTLRHMARGGMNDQLGGGFHRYSVDGQWRVPHFEKMLYDQAQLARSATDMYQITGDRFFAGVTRSILDYVLRDMTSPSGAFYSAEDADSQNPENPAEHSEGAYYLWSKKEITTVLSGEDSEIFCTMFGVTDGGNALADPQMEFAGKNILYEARSAEETALLLSLSVARVNEGIRQSRSALLAVRARRARPHLDDKIITAWNGLMISAFSRAYAVLGDPRYLEAARRAAAEIHRVLYNQETHSLLRRYRDGDARFPGHLDDYSFLIAGLIDLSESSLDHAYLEWAIDLMKRQLELFWDEQRGGFFDTAEGDPSLLVRMKEFYDGAEPSGNSIAAMNLLRLSQYTERSEWWDMAGKTIRSDSQMLTQHPSAVPQMAAALDYFLSEPRQIVVAGSPDDERTKTLLSTINKHYLPNTVLLLAVGGEEQDRLSELLPLLRTADQIDGKPAAYVCEDFVCSLPVTDPMELEQLLTRRRVHS